MKMTSAKNELHHFPVHKNLQPAIYKGQFCPTSNIQGRVCARSSTVTARKHRHCPEPLSLALLGHGSSKYQEGEKAGLLTVRSRNENPVVGLNFSVWI